MMSRIYLGREMDRERQGNCREKSTKSVQRIMIRPVLLGYLESDCSNPTE